MSEKNVIPGTPNDDHLKGTDKADEISGGKGHDKIEGGKGDDTLKGEGDNDTILGGEGHDTVYGGLGNDKIEGGAGHDTLEGDTGHDEALGGTKDTHIGGHDDISGGDGHDNIHGHGGDDELKGDGGNDTLFGCGGNDTMYGGIGDDYIADFRGDGHDTFDGGVGRDTMMDGDGNDLLVGGEDSDIYIFTHNGKGHNTIKDDGGLINIMPSPDKIVSLDVFEVTQNGADLIITRKDQDFSIKILNGVANVKNFTFGHNHHPYNIVKTDEGYVLESSINRQIKGTDESETLEGGIGNDFLFGKGGNDTLKGKGGGDLLVGGKGDDTLEGGKDYDVYFYSDRQPWGHDTIKDDGGRVVFAVEGAFKRSFTNSLVLSQDNNDLIIKRLRVVNREKKELSIGKESSIRVINGVSNKEKFTFFYGDDSFKLVEPMDNQYVLIPAKSIAGTKNDDILNGTTEGDNILGYAGNDILNGHGGNDTLYGDENNDTLNGGAGEDHLLGGLGNDILRGGTEEDSYIFHTNNEGHDTIEDDGGILIFLASYTPKDFFKDFTIKKDGTTLVMKKDANSSVKVLNYASNSKNFSFSFGATPLHNLIEANGQYKFVLANK